MITIRIVRFLLTIPLVMFVVCFDEYDAYGYTHYPFNPAYCGDCNAIDYINACPRFGIYDAVCCIGMNGYYTETITPEHVQVDQWQEYGTWFLGTVPGECGPETVMPGSIAAALIEVNDPVYQSPFYAAISALQLQFNVGLSSYFSFGLAFDVGAFLNGLTSSNARTFSISQISGGLCPNIATNCEEQECVVAKTRVVYHYRLVSQRKRCELIWDEYNCYSSGASQCQAVSCPSGKNGPTSGVAVCFLGHVASIFNITTQTVCLKCDCVDCEDGVGDCDCDHLLNL